MLDYFGLLVMSEVAGVGRRSVNFIADSTFSTPESAADYFDLFKTSNRSNQRIKVPTIQQIDAATVRAREICDLSYKHEIKIIGKNDQDFPEALKEIPDPPAILYVKGNLEVLKSELSVAVIGTREPTEFGYASGKRLASVLTKHGFVIVSGLALGCDTAAHEGCLAENGKTIAVLAHGLDKIYPSKNKELAKEIIEKSGCLVSEYAPEIKARSNFFVDRDRLQSGLSRAVVVIETAIKGGTMHTVKFCNEQGRILATLDHPEKYLINNIKAEGNQFLIREMNATPIFDKDSLQLFINKIKGNGNISIKKQVVDILNNDDNPQLRLGF